MDRHSIMPEYKKDAPARKERTLAEISVTNWLTPQNTSFFMRNGFLYVLFEEKERRIRLCREFPFEMEWEFISAIDDEDAEVGIIRRVEDFEGEARELLVQEIRRRYYTMEILEIKRVKEKYGFSFWKVHTPDGEVNFTLRDTYRSITRAGDGRVILTDADGNRFEIPDVHALDRKSFKRIELYL